MGKIDLFLTDLGAGFDTRAYRFPTLSKYTPLTNLTIEAGSGNRSRNFFVVILG